MRVKAGKVNEDCDLQTGFAEIRVRECDALYIKQDIKDVNSAALNGLNVMYHVLHVAHLRI
jgi:hypothetical protein